MDEKYQELTKISTQWSKMEELIYQEGPAALAEYLASHYFNALALTLQKKNSYLDEFQAYSLASDIIYDFIKNDYHSLKNLRRDRGHLRGLFLKIIRAKLSKWKKTPSTSELDHHQDDTEPWVDFYLDLEEALSKLQKERPLLYKPFVMHYLEGKKISEISQLLHIKENAVKQRLFSARKWLAKHLPGYS